NDRRFLAVVFDWPGVAAHQNFRAVGLVMDPILFAAVLGEVISGVVECPLTFVCGPYVQRSHNQELVARIAVVLNSRGIDGKEFQAWSFEDPHRNRAALEQQVERLRGGPVISYIKPAEPIPFKGPSLLCIRNRDCHAPTGKPSKMA